MILQDQTVICIKTDEETWDLFNDNYYIKELPKRQQLQLLKEGLLGHIFDINVASQFRKVEHYKSISLWATHMMALSKFVKEETTDWLVVIENQVNLEQIHEPERGFTILAQNAAAYIVDRHTAEIIIDNSLIYYDTFLKTIKDLNGLGLITIHETKTPFSKLQKNKLYFYLPFILVLLFALIVLFSPLYSILTKGLVGFAKMTGTEEAMMSGKG